MSRRMRIKGVLNLKPKVGVKTDVPDVNKAPPEPSTLVKEPESVPDVVSLKSKENLDNRTFCAPKDSVVPNLSAVQEVEISSKDDATKSVTTNEVIESSTTFVKPSVNIISQRTVPKPPEAPSEPTTPNVTCDISTTLELNPAKHLNRSRIKAVPILTRQAGSASESEDDPKRVRTESVSQSQPNHFVTQEHSTIVQRKCRRSEQSRKMAEAKKTFATKFGDKNPDKQKLTMIDLIFYNPTSNPMPQKQKKPNTITEKEYQQKSEEVNEDDPPPPVEESDEENRVPAPRVTVGPNGEIIVDEKSLVIEDRDVKRKRAELEKSEAIDADFEGGSGFYKRVKRCKDWTKEETLLFYRCLNTLGTDFTMMTQLFKGRTRKELKMKFKKEERLNSYLINKAISQPVHFNINDLKEEVENQEKSVQQHEEKKKRLKEAQSKVAERIPYITPKIRSTSAKNRICQVKHKPVKSIKKDTYSCLERGFKLSSSDSEDSEEETTKLLRPTRSGRVPKLNKTYDNSEELVDDDEKEEPEEESPSGNLVPGSIVIVTTPTEDGGTRMQVFMSTPNGSQVPLTISPEMLNSLMSQHALLNSQDVSSPPTEVKTVKDDSNLEEAACSADSCDLVIDE